MTADHGSEHSSGSLDAPRLSGKVSLLDLYTLRDFANSVARQDPQTGAKRKLRKSYKNHIADLPGKHPIPGPNETAWTLLDAAIRPPPRSAQDAAKSLDFPPEMLAKLRFQKSMAPLPNFDSKLLAAPGMAESGSGLGVNPLNTNETNAGSPMSHATSRANSPLPDERLEKRKRKEALAAEKRRRV